MFNYIWIALATVFFVLEAITVGLTCIWFAFGSLIAFVASFFIHSTYIQAAIGIVSSFILITLTKPIAEKYLGTGKIEKTNFDRIIGMDGIVSEDINHLKNTGCVMVDGKSWTAISADREIIKKYTPVVIKEIKGCKVVVSKKETENISEE